MVNDTSESQSQLPSDWNGGNKETQDKTMADEYNVDTAENLANEAMRMPITEAMPIYDQLLATFPTAARYWKQYVEAFMAINNDDATRQIFSRCLLNCLQVPLWYIVFVASFFFSSVLVLGGSRFSAIIISTVLFGCKCLICLFDFMLNYVGKLYS